MEKDKASLGQKEEEVVYAGVGSQSDLGSAKGLQARGVVRGGKFLLLAGSVIAAAAPSLPPKFSDMRARHLAAGSLESAPGGCFKVVQDLEFDSASQAFVYAYGTRPSGGRATWTPPSSSSARAVHKHTSAVSASSSLVPASPTHSLAPPSRASSSHSTDHDGDGDDEWDESDTVEEMDVYPSGFRIKKEKEEEEEEEGEEDEVEAELAYIEAKIRLLQVRKNKLLRRRQVGASLRASTNSNNNNKKGAAPQAARALDM